MKNILFIITLLLSSSLLHGQSQPIPISLAYFSQVGIEPGLKISAELPIKALESEAKNKQLFVSPQIGFFVRPNHHTNVLLMGDIGIKKQKEGKSAFSTFSLGLGYWYQSQIQSLTVQLGDGSQSQNRTNNHYFLPTINYSFGSKLIANSNWYSKIGVGQRFGGSASSTTTVLLELGLQFSF